MTKLILAHCIENQMVAAKIASALKEKATIENVVFDFSNGMEALRKATYSSTAPVLLLISDNFLKSEKCMNDALSLIQSLGTSQRLISVTTEGIYQENGRPVIFPTSFDRVSNVIQYMNYWQDRYLDLRRAKAEGDEAAFNEKVRVVRTISSEVGELLRYLRSTEYYSYDQFEDSNFIVLYRVLGIPVSEQMAIESRTFVNHGVESAALVGVEELEVAHAGETNGSYNPFANGIHFGSKNGTTETNNYLESLLGEEKAASPIDSANVPTMNNVTVSEAADKMKELASNGVEKMNEMRVETPINTTQVVDNQSPTSDFQIRANELINQGLDRPTSLESLISGMRDEKPRDSNTEISANLNDKVDEILDVKKASLDASKGFGGFTLEQILKDEELLELMHKEGVATPEIVATETVENGVHAEALAAPTLSNGNGLNVELDDSDSDLVKQIAAEAEKDFQEKLRLKRLAETPTKAEDDAPVAVEATIEKVAMPVVEHVVEAAPIVENFTEKADSEFRDLTENVHPEDVKSDVSRIFEEAEQPAEHFEFEENHHHKLTEETAALFDQPTAPRTAEKIVNQLVIERGTPAEAVKMDEPTATTANLSLDTEGGKSGEENVQSLLE